MAVTIGAWRFYTDATPDGSMSPLAAENTAPTLTGPQTMGGIIRLRVQLVGDATGGTITLNGAHGMDGTNWKVWAANGVTSGNEWVRWASGAATAGNAVGTLLLTGSTVAGNYLEAGGQSVVVGANEEVEVDLAITPQWWGPSFTVLLQLRNGTTPLSYEAGVPQVQATACDDVTRDHTIGRAGMTGTGQVREVDYSCWPRMIHDGSYWWWICAEPDVSTAQVGTWKWNGAGGVNGDWVKETVTPGGTIAGGAEGDARIAPNSRKVGSNVVAQVALRPTTGNMRLLRGTFSSGTATWTNVDLGRAPYNTSSGYTFHADIDAGGYHWIAGFDGTAGVWACRTQSADTGGSFTPDFGTLDTRRKTLTDAVTAGSAGNPIAVVGLGSDKALLVWVSGTSLRAVTVTDAGGFGTAATASASALANSHDWGIARSWDGTEVYLVYRVGSALEFRIYNVAGNSWSTGAAPNEQALISNNDGVIVSVDASSVYAFTTGVGAGGNQDRPIQKNVYTVATSTWATYSFITPEQRGNGDDIAGCSRIGTDGNILVGYLWGDCDVSGHAFTYEYFAVAGDAGGQNFTQSPTDAVGLVDSRALARGLAAGDPTGPTDSATSSLTSPTVVTYRCDVAVD